MLCVSTWARSLALVVMVAAQCVLHVVAQDVDEEDAFADAPEAPVSDVPPELLAYQSYMGYLNKAVPILGGFLLFFIYFGTGWLSSEKTIQGPRVHVSHILVKDEAEADAIRKEIKNAPRKTQKFVELAARKSSCPSKSKGGQMGVFGKGQMMPEFNKIVFTEPVGSLHVVKTKFGYHVVMITKREGEATSDLKRKKH